jgi:1-acyl-sn-glycerol-3-phosphate acyltransferase
MRSGLRRLAQFLVAHLARVEVSGLESLPPGGPYLLVSNHLSIADVAVVYALVGGENVTGWAAEKYRFHPIFGLILRLAGGIFIRRGAVDRAALDAAVEALRSGMVFGMAPEGTRSRTGGLMRGKTGAAYLAHEADVPIVPLGLIGTEAAFRSLARLRRARLTVRIGPPFRLPALDAADRSAGLRAHTDEIMCRIAALLPPAYRGVYADHPRLLRLLQGTRPTTRPGAGLERAPARGR